MNPDLESHSENKWNLSVASVYNFDSLGEESTNRG